MTLIEEIDYGTPATNATRSVTLSIDGFPVTVPEGTSIMRAAMEAGVQIPKLCATDMLDAFGSCRLCLVEIDGRNGTPASCTTPVAEGLVVHTQTTRLKQLRRGVMELYISDHPLDCLTCAANGNCELQDMAGAVGLREVRYGFAGENHLDAAKDESNPYFTFDAAKCIVCSRCVRACEEVQGTFALTIEGRGFDSKVSPSAGEAFLESECVSCGACVQACPTATLMEKSVIEIGQPEHSVVTTCAYCGVGCSFKAEMRGDEVVRMVPYKDGKANHGHSCVKGRFAWGYATHPDRVLTPMLRERITDPWRPVSWDEAIAHVAREFRRIQAEHGKHAVGGITSSRCTNEETYLVQKLVRAGFGNNNVDTCARVCHSPTGYGLKATLGESAGTQDFDSIEQTDVVLVIGANPTDAHPVFGSQMKQRLRAGARLIVVDPRRIDLVRTPHIQADYHLKLRPGTNVAVLNSLAHVIVTEGLSQAVAGGRMAHACAGVHVVVPEPGAHELLHQVGFLVGAARGGNATDRMRAVCLLDALELAGDVRERLAPAHRLPRVGDFRADHRRGDAVRMAGVADREAALDAGMAVVGVAVLVRHHAHDFLALHLGAEAAADAAVGAGGGDAVLGLAALDQRVLAQRGGGAGLHAGAAGHALGAEEILVLAGRHFRVETAALDGQREGALHLVAGAHAARADDALGRIEGEVRR